MAGLKDLGILLENDISKASRNSCINATFPLIALDILACFKVFGESVSDFFNSFIAFNYAISLQYHYVKDSTCSFSSSNHSCAAQRGIFKPTFRSDVDVAEFMRGNFSLVRVGCHLLLYTPHSVPRVGFEAS